MNVRVTAATLGLTLLLAACGEQSPTAQAAPGTGLPTAAARTQAPLLGAGNPDAIAGQYIVVFSDGAMPDLAAQSAGGLIGRLGLDPQGITVQHIYAAALNGFAARLSAQNLAKLQADRRVKYVQQDSVVRASATQSGAVWGLDRIDQRSLPLNGSYVYDTAASNVKVYIIDTGIRITHQEFGGRAIWGTNQTGDGNNTDCGGHGTHVAGTVGSSTYGVAKSVKLVAVKVLGCNGSGSNSGIIAGINWAVSNKGSATAIANMSLGGGRDQASNDAVNTAVNKGLFIAVAAGNENQDACNVSPASAEKALTVGATTRSDRRADPNDWGYTQAGSPLGSNYGSCVDLFAPGTGITSTLSTGDTAVSGATWNGTSMATPHVAGAAALILAANPSYTPDQIRAALLNGATTGKLSNLGGSVDRLLFTNPGGGTTDPAPTPNTQTYTGSVAAGQNSYQPNTTGFNYAGGTLKASLSGPAGTDFDLYLYRYQNGAWNVVAQSDGSTSTEGVTYTAASGTYIWGIYAYSGSGSYTLTESK